MLLHVLFTDLSFFVVLVVVTVFVVNDVDNEFVDYYMPWAMRSL